MALPFPELLLSADTGAFTALGSVADTSDPPAWLPLPGAELPEALPFPDPLLPTETGRLIAPGSPIEISDALPPFPPDPP